MRTIRNIKLRRYTHRTLEEFSKRKQENLSRKQYISYFKIRENRSKLFLFITELVSRTNESKKKLKKKKLSQLQGKK